MRVHILLGVSLFPLSAMAAPPKLVTDMPVTASLVQQVIGDLGEVTPLLDAGSDPHDFQLRPSQARALQDAGLLIWMGPEMTVWLNSAASSLGEASQMQLLHQPGTHLREFTVGDGHDHAGAHDHDHAHDHEAQAEGEAEADHDHGHDHAAHGHDHSPGSLDPHAWLDPENGRLWLGQIAERLAELDPENAETYRANAKAGAESLTALEARIAADLAPVRDHPFIAFHDAYGYYTDHFGLPEAVTVTIGDASAPSAARIQSVRDRIAQSGAVCAFAEVGHPVRMIESVIEGTPVKMGAQISPTGSDLEAGSDLYGEILSQLSERIVACATGSE